MGINMEKKKKLLVTGLIVAGVGLSVFTSERLLTGKLVLTSKDRIEKQLDNRIQELDEEPVYTVLSDNKYAYILDLSECTIDFDKETNNTKIHIANEYSDVITTDGNNITILFNTRSVDEAFDIVENNYKNLTPVSFADNPKEDYMEDDSVTAFYKFVRQFTGKDYKKRVR